MSEQIMICSLITQLAGVVIGRRTPNRRNPLSTCDVVSDSYESLMDRGSRKDRAHDTSRSPAFGPSYSAE
jgi:hypothetical protein